MYTCSMINIKTKMRDAIWRRFLLELFNISGKLPNEGYHRMHKLIDKETHNLKITLAVDTFKKTGPTINPIDDV